MAKVRKYQEYQIKVNFIDGNSETLKVKGICTSSYKEMLKLYNDVKDTYTNDKEVVSILFLGVTANKQLEVMWEKVVNSPEDELINYTIPSVYNVLENLDNQIKALSERKDYLNSMLSVYIKKEDILRHRLDNLIDCDLNDPKYDNMKNRFFKDMAEVRSSRRDAKNELLKIDKLYEALSNINLKKLSTKEQYVCNFWDENCLNKNKVYGETSYETEIEKEKLMSKYYDNFPHVVVSDIEKKIYGYRNLGIGKDNNKDKSIVVNGKRLENYNPSVPVNARILKVKVIKCNSQKMMENMRTQLADKFNNFVWDDKRMELTAQKLG